MAPQPPVPPALSPIPPHRLSPLQNAAPRQLRFRPLDPKPGAGEHLH